MLLSSDERLFGAILFLLWQVFCFIRKIPARKNLIASLFIIYLILLVGITLFPIPYQSTGGMYDCNLNLIPFKSIISTLKGDKSIAVKQIFGNIIMCIPFGILFPFLIRKKSWSVKIMAAFCFTTSIELVQFFIGLLIGYRYRTVDIDDIILNVIGCLIGYMIYRILPLQIQTLYSTQQNF